MLMPLQTREPATLHDGCLHIQGHTLLTDVPETIQLVEDPRGIGVFLSCTAEHASSTLLFLLGTVSGVTRFAACPRSDPFWMYATTGIHGGEVPCETQFLLLELTDGRCAVALPILDTPFRASLQGYGEEGLALRAETGDTATRGATVTGLFLAVGDDPYALMAAAARSVMARMGSGRLRADKPLPDFIDLFGWCTWDACYYEVSQEKVRQGLASFAEGGVSPTYMILDDGWLSSLQQPTGEWTLGAFEANARFPDGLASLVRMTKEEFGLRCFMVWHAFHGYWNGIDAASFPRYRVQRGERRYRQELVDICDWVREKEERERIFNLVVPDDIARFHQDFHSFLLRQGVDGVKVDHQAATEAAASGQGGRVALMQRYHVSLDASAQAHFLGRIINCMSCSNDMLYSALNSTITRTSDDFHPRMPEVHGIHIYNNALVSFFAGEFIHPDWDMFWSLHPQAELHAIARAVSGGPVYVSDEIGRHDFAVLRKLVCTDGTILRARGIGRPTRDCLFTNPVREDVPLKVFNHNLDAGVVGVFAVRYESEMGCTATVRPADVDGLAGERFAVYAHHAQRLTLCTREEAIPVTLAPLSAEIVTIVPLEDGYAALGLLDKYNSAGAITGKGFTPHGAYAVTVRDGGRFGAWCADAPAAIHVDNTPHPFTYTADSGMLCVEIAAAGTHVVTIIPKIS